MGGVGRVGRGGVSEPGQSEWEGIRESERGRASVRRGAGRVGGGSGKERVGRRAG